jgi:hypothetical protein
MCANVISELQQHTSLLLPATMTLSSMGADLLAQAL